MGEESEGREQGRGCYPDGCRQRSDGSAALRAVPEPRGIPTRCPANIGAQTRGFIGGREDRRLAATARRYPASTRSANSRGGEPSVRRCPPTTKRSRARGVQHATPPKFRVSYCAIGHRAGPFSPFRTRKGERVCATTLRHRAKIERVCSGEFWQWIAVIEMTPYEFMARLGGRSCNWSNNISTKILDSLLSTTFHVPLHY